jgi:hypothetical protein
VVLPPLVLPKVPSTTERLREAVPAERPVLALPSLVSSQKAADAVDMSPGEFDALADAYGLPHVIVLGQRRYHLGDVAALGTDSLVGSHA